MKLDRLVLVNWGQLRPGNYDIGDMTLLTGPTGSGKSTMLDALQTLMTAAYQGIVNYNPGQDEVKGGQRRGKTKRTLESFVVGAEYSKFSRPDGAHGYVAAVFRPSHGEEGGKTFTAVVAVAARVDGTGESRMAKLEKLELVIVDDAALTVDDFAKNSDAGEWVAVDDIVRRLKAKHPKVTTFDGHKKDYLSALYGRFRGRNSVTWDEAQNAAKAWAQSIAYKPIGSVHELVRDDILEFDGKQLQESITRISDLMRQVTNLKQEGRRLDEAVTRLAELKTALGETAHAYEEQVTHDLALARLHVRGDDEQISALQNKKKEDRALCGQYLRQYKAEEILLDGVDLSRIELHARLKGVRAHGEKEDLEHKLARATSGAKSSLETLSKSLLGAAHLDNTARQLIGKPIPEQFPRLSAAVQAVARAVAVTGFDRLAQLRDSVADASAGDKLDVFKLLRLPAAFEGAEVGIAEVYQSLAGPTDSVAIAIATEGANLDSRVANAITARTDLAEQKARLTGGGANYPREIRFALERLREELPNANVQVLCDLIEPASDEWQPSLEAYLSGARFNLIVNPDSESEAIEFVHRSHLKAKVIQGADCLAKADASRVPRDSIIHELSTQHPIALAYLVDMYGPVVKVTTTEQLRRTPRGVMISGKASGGRTMFSLEPADLVFGRAARERALNVTREKLEQAETELKRLQILATDLANVRRLLANLREPDFAVDALTEYATDIDHARRSLCQLDLTEVQDLMDQLVVLQAQIAEHTANIESAKLAESLSNQRITDYDGHIGRLDGRRGTQLVEVERQLQRLKHLCDANSEKTYTVMSDEVDQRVSRPYLTAADLDKDVQRLRALPEKRMGDVREMLSEYNVHARQDERFPAALPHFHGATVFDPYYESVIRLGRDVTQLHVDLDSLGLYKNRNEVDKAERSFHDVFTKQFCVEIKIKVDDGIRSLRQLNGELANLRFGSDRFTLDWSKWDPEFEEYYAFFKTVAELADSPESVDLFGVTELTPKEIGVRDRLVKLLLEPDQERATRDLLRIADYRNYRRYDIWNESDSGGRIALSTWGTGSGGQLETPAYIVRAAVVTNRLKCFEKGPSLKLLVSDESFSKMDEPRARTVLRFLHDNLGLQVISAMPTRSAGGLRPEFTREYCYSRADVGFNGELDFVLDCDDRELRSDKMRDLWEAQRKQVRDQAKLSFDETEPLEPAEPST